MGFWIVLGVIVLVVTIVIVHYAVNWHEFAIGPALIALVAGGIIGAAIVGIGTINGPTTAEKLETHNLRALVTKEQTESHARASFFLGFGYASSSSTEVTSISYIQTDMDGGSTIQKATIGQSIIYEDTAKPYVEDWYTVHHVNTAWWPWGGSWTELGEAQHRFHIPAGTILENYEVTP